MLKKVFAAFALMVCAAVSMGQDMAMPQIPKEVEQLNPFIGKWKADLTMSFMGTDSKGEGTMNCKMSLNKRWMESDHTYKGGGVPGEMLGKMLVTYNPEKKKWMSYWFDSEAAEVLAMEGTFDNKTLLVESKPMTMMGMPGEVSMRATFKFTSASKCDFLLEMKQDGKWMNLIKGTYTKQ